MARKLYEVTVSFTYYAHTDAVRDAVAYAEQAWQDGGADHRQVTLVQTSDHRLAGEWAPECLVYGASDDVELGDLLAQLPTREALGRPVAPVRDTES